MKRENCNEEQVLLFQNQTQFKEQFKNIHKKWLAVNDVLFEHKKNNHFLNIPQKLKEPLSALEKNKKLLDEVKTISDKLFPFDKNVYILVFNTNQLQTSIAYIFQNYFLEYAVYEYFEHTHDYMMYLIFDFRKDNKDREFTFVNKAFYFKEYQRNFFFSFSKDYRYESEFAYQRKERNKFRKRENFSLQELEEYEKYLEYCDHCTEKDWEIYPEPNDSLSRNWENCELSLSDDKSQIVIKI